MVTLLVGLVEGNNEHKEDEGTANGISDRILISCTTPLLFLTNLLLCLDWLELIYVFEICFVIPYLIGTLGYFYASQGNYII